MYEKTVLDNGLKVITGTMPHSRSISIAFLVGASGRDSMVGGSWHISSIKASNGLYI
ncbi:unnamed protein product [marine sediment metagenome]|uniref:Uncharacterized protein n=1 Tax=marine sediment metagenome TaxID=412755 RepID=X1PLK7_9ZZZZ